MNVAEEGNHGKRLFALAYAAGPVAGQCFGDPDRRPETSLEARTLSPTASAEPENITVQEDFINTQGKKLNSIPERARERTRVLIWGYRGLKFRLVIHPQ